MIFVGKKSLQEASTQQLLNLFKGKLDNKSIGIVYGYGWEGF
jgi:hypothetical protein